MAPLYTSSNHELPPDRATGASVLDFLLAFTATAGLLTALLVVTARRVVTMREARRESAAARMAKMVLARGVDDVSGGDNDVRASRFGDPLCAIAPFVYYHPGLC